MAAVENKPASKFVKDQSRKPKSKCNIHELLIQIVEKVEDLQGIIITDIDGVTVSKGFVSELVDKTDDPELSSIHNAIQQACKLDFGPCTSLITYYENCILVHITSTKQTLIMTLICLKTVNMDTIVYITNKLEITLNTLETEIEANNIKK